MARSRLLAVRRHAAAHHLAAVLVLALLLALAVLLLAPRAVSAVTITQITLDGADDSGPAWSPDGQRIAFVSNRAGSNEIWAMNATDRAPTRLTFNGVYDGGPTFTPDGQWIVYDSSLASDYQEELYRVPAAGGSSLRLTYNDRRDLEATAGFAGSWVICHTIFGGNWEVAVYDAMNGILVTLATLHAAQDVEPGFAPAMDRFVFQSNRSGNREIWVAPLPAGAQGTQGHALVGRRHPAPLVVIAEPHRVGERPAVGDGRGAPGDGVLSLDELRQLPFDIWITTEDGTFTVPITTTGSTTHARAGRRRAPDRLPLAPERELDIFIADDLPLVTPSRRQAGARSRQRAWSAPAAGGDDPARGARVERVRIESAARKAVGFPFGKRDWPGRPTFPRLAACPAR